MGVNRYDSLCEVTKLLHVRKMKQYKLQKYFLHCNKLCLVYQVVYHNRSCKGRLAGKRAKVGEGRLQGQGADFYILAIAPPPSVTNVPCNTNSTCIWYTKYTILTYSHQVFCKSTPCNLSKCHFYHEIYIKIVQNFVLSVHGRGGGGV